MLSTLLLAIIASPALGAQSKKDPLTPALGASHEKVTLNSPVVQVLVNSKQECLAYFHQSAFYCPAGCVRGDGPKSIEILVEDAERAMQKISVDEATYPNTVTSDKNHDYAKLRVDGVVQNFASPYIENGLRQLTASTVVEGKLEVSNFEEVGHDMCYAVYKKKK